MYKINKMNLRCIRCLEITYNSTSNELKYGIGRINMLYSYCIDRGFKKCIVVDRE